MHADKISQKLHINSKEVQQEHFTRMQSHACIVLRRDGERTAVNYVQIWLGRKQCDCKSVGDWFGKNNHSLAHYKAAGPGVRAP